MELLSVSASVAPQLRSVRAELAVLRHRVESVIALVADSKITGWSGPASVTYRKSLAELRRECESVKQLLRSAENSLDQAVFEVAGHD